jgi:hypothetical protein
MEFRKSTTKRLDRLYIAEETKNKNKIQRTQVTLRAEIVDTNNPLHKVYVEYLQRRKIDSND